MKPRRIPPRQRYKGVLLPPIDRRHWFRPGDWLAFMLSLIGITELRIMRLRCRFGRRPQCGCEEKRRRINEWADRLRAWLRRRFKATVASEPAAPP